MTITVQSVTKQFHNHIALDSVDVTIPGSSLTALIGPSGSGKSTLLRVIAGLETPDSGRILVDGTDVSLLPVRSRGIGFVFQHYAAFKHMTVWDNIAFGLTIKRSSGHKKEYQEFIQHKVNELISLVRLNGFENRLPSQLSGGQRQRMALARALAIEPKVLLLDEPFGALDPKVRDELREWLRLLHQERDLTTVLVTHDQAEALEVADTIIVLNHGITEQVGTPQNVYDSPVNEFVMRFLGNVSRINGRLIRPHDLRVGRSPDLAISETRKSPDVERDPLHRVQEVTVQRVIFLGFEVRVELENSQGEVFLAQITRGDARALQLQPGEKVYVRATR